MRLSFQRDNLLYLIKLQNSKGIHTSWMPFFIANYLVSTRGKQMHSLCFSRLKKVHRTFFNGATVFKEIICFILSNCKTSKGIRSLRMPFFIANYLVSTRGKQMHSLNPACPRNRNHKKSRGIRFCEIVCHSFSFLLIYYFLGFKTAFAPMQSNIVIIISGRVFPTGISIFINRR